MWQEEYMADLLIVDDDIGIRNMLRLMFDSHGYTAQTADTAEAAIALLADIPFSLMITDLNLPGMNGLALAKLVGERISDMPIIMITASNSSELASEVASLGISAVFTKPFKFEDLLQVVRSLVKQSKYLTDADFYEAASAVT